MQSVHQGCGLLTHCMNHPANLAMPLSSCDLSENDLGDSSVAALLKACERRNYSYNKGAPLQQLNLTANRITKVGQLWIATYLKEAAGKFLCPRPA